MAWHVVGQFIGDSCYPMGMLLVRTRVMFVRRVDEDHSSHLG